jgi:hypothetical protein
MRLSCDMFELQLHFALSKHSHISNTRKTLKILSINELFIYMKLVFIKNLKNNIICERIFYHLLVIKYKKK